MVLDQIRWRCGGDKSKIYWINFESKTTDVSKIHHSFSDSFQAKKN
jgi:hypothetical protein